MSIKKIVITTILFFGIVAVSKNCFSIELLNQKQALKEMFPDADKIETKTIALSTIQINNIKKGLGGSLVHHQKGAKSKEVKEKTKYAFYFGIKNGQKIGVAIIDEQPGKWGPVKYIIALDTSTAKVKNLAVMSYTEKRGRPIARRNFLGQFIGKGGNDKIKVHKDIRAISGATISSDATCFAIRKAIVLYEELFLKK